MAFVLVEALQFNIANMILAKSLNHLTLTVGIFFFNELISWFRKSPRFVPG